MATVSYGRSPQRTLAEDGVIPIFGTGGLERFGKDFLYEGESIVLGRKGTIDNPVYINGKFWAIDTTYFLHDFKDADVKWLYYFLRTIDFRSMNEATGVPSLSRDYLYSIGINTPPKDEQTRIAAVLSCIDRSIDQTDALIAKQERIKAGLMEGLLTKGIDAHGKIRSEAIHQFKDSSLGRNPEQWSICTIERLIESAVDGPFGSNLKTEHYVNEPGTRVVRLQNIGEGFFDNRDKAHISDEHADKLRRHAVMPGDLVIASLGDERHPIARACLYPKYLEPGIVKADCFRVRLKPKEALNSYLMHVLNCPSTRNDINVLAQGVTRDRINLASFRSIRVRRPPKKEQQQIVGALNSHQDEMESIDRELSKLWLVKDGLMQDLLRGRVRVESLLQPCTGVQA